jgi:membrane protease YdiL (CAAX protease family)
MGHGSPPPLGVRHRRRVLTATAVAGAAQLAASLASAPDSRRFYVLTTGVTATWVAGGLATAPVPWTGDTEDPTHRTVLRAVATGVGAFLVFYGCALVARKVPFLRHALAGVLRYAHHGRTPMVLATALTTGAAEEVFFRGAVYDALADRHPIPASTAAYALVTCATGNPALAMASVVMGALFGWQRATTGGIQAPMVTHLTWTTLMVWLLPPLFRDVTTQLTQPR